MDLKKQVLQSKLGLPPSRAQSKTGHRGPRRKSYKPEEWSRFFIRDEDVTTQRGKFHVYHGGDGKGPLMVLLHGGGYSALTWSVFSVAISSMIDCDTLAIDLRGHGSTETDSDEDLSAETMARDVGEVLTALHRESSPPTIVLGHSMGGAIAVHAAAGGHIPNLIGVVVIDVVEGTAMESLTSMQTFLRGRPTKFPTVEHAIEWCLKSGQTRNIDAAQVSMPGQLKSLATGRCAAENLHDVAVEDAETAPLVRSNSAAAILEEDEESEESATSQEEMHDTTVEPLPGHPGYTWRIDLSKTERFWSSWFHGLSNKFLSIPVAKILLLAAIDRLDKDLTIGQMQGKFQMHVLPQCGHAVHEDVPEKVAEVVATFLVRNKFTEAKESFHRPFPCC